MEPIFEKIILSLMITLGLSLLIIVIISLTYVLYNILKRYSIQNVEYKRYFTEKGAFEGQEVYLVEEFTNRSFLPLFRVGVETHVTTKLYLPGCVSGNEINQQFLSCFFVMPYTRVKRRHRVICLKRGYYRLESAKLNFMRIESFVESVAEILVYPSELSIEENNNINNFFQNTTFSNMPLIRDAFSFSGIREYMNGDTISSINHKASARAGKLMVNNNDYVFGRKVQVYINFQEGNEGIPLEEFSVIMETAMSFTTYLAGKALRNGWQLGVSANSKMINGSTYFALPMSSGYNKYIELLEGLASMRIIYGNSIEYIMNIDLDKAITNTEIILMSAYIDESIQTKINGLERLGNKVNIINLKEAVDND